MFTGLGALMKGELPIGSIPKTFTKVPADLIAAADAVSDKTTMVEIFIFTNPPATFKQMRSKSPNYTAGAVLIKEGDGVINMNFPLWKVWIFEVMSYVSAVKTPAEMSAVAQPAVVSIAPAVTPSTPSPTPVATPLPVLTSPVTTAPTGVPATEPYTAQLPLFLPAEEGFMGISMMNWLLIGGGLTAAYLLMSRKPAGGRKRK